MQVARRLSQSIVGILALIVLLTGYEQSPNPAGWIVMSLAIGGGLIYLLGWIFADKNTDE